VRVPDIPLAQIGEDYERKQPFPWHRGRSLCREWFDERNDSADRRDDRAAEAWAEPDLPAAWLAAVRHELTALAQETEKLLANLCARLGRGLD